MLRALRFYLIVDAPPRWLMALAAAAGTYAIAVAWLDRSGVDEALAVVLLWQMLAGSTGFIRAAAAGHFDPLLVAESRTAVALGHLVYSIAPGALLWLGIAVVETLRYPPPQHAFELARLAAFVFVSTAAWAFSLPLARMVFGALWLLGIVIAATTRVGVEQYAALAAREGGTLGEGIHAALISLACPFVLIGTAMPARHTSSAALLAMALAVVLGATVYLARRDYPLEAA